MDSPQSMKEDAYVAVLKAFHATKYTNWSQQQLLRSLREALAISQDQHIACLSRVLRDPTTTTEPAAKERTIKQSSTSDVKRKSVHSTKLERHEKPPPLKKPKMKNRELGTHPGKESNPEDSTVQYLALTQDVIHGLDHSGLNYLYGKELETYWEEEMNEEGKWYSALVTDYNSALKQHKLSYDHGAFNESFEWVKLDEEVKKGNVRLAQTEKLPTFQIGQSRKLGEAPFDDNVFEKMLKDGSIDELKWMLSKVQSKMLQLCSQLKPPKHPATQEEAIVTKIITRGNLITSKKKEMKIS
eukprot:g3596.t1